MKRKKLWLRLGIILFLLVLFRGALFRMTVYYSQIGNRETFKLTNPTLLKEIQDKKGKKHLSLEEIMDLSLKITTNNLQFSAVSTSQNPNTTYEVGKAHCVGYAAMFNSIANHLIMEQQEQDKYISHHLIGKLDFIGIEVHQFFNTPFFKDHDFNEVYNLETKTSIFIDASVSDYLWIYRVDSSK